MKQFIYCFLILAVFLSVSCRPKSKSPGVSPTSFSYTLKKDSCYFLMKINDYNNTHLVWGLENKYSVQWPDETLPHEVEQELLSILFKDTTASIFDEAATRWVQFNECEDIWQDNMQFNSSTMVNSSLMEEVHLLCNNYVENKITVDENLVEFSIFEEAYMGGAHGVHYWRTRTYDRNTGHIIRFPDLVDTTDFSEVITRAIEDLEVNKMVRECLFDEDMRGGFYIPSDFYIDSTRSTITLIYQIYEIACFACGTQEVILPIFWLSKHRNLTPYAKEIFGEESSL